MKEGRGRWLPAATAGEEKGKHSKAQKRRKRRSKDKAKASKRIAPSHQANHPFAAIHRAMCEPQQPSCTTSSVATDSSVDADMRRGDSGGRSGSHLRSSSEERKTSAAVTPDEGKSTDFAGGILTPQSVSRGRLERTKARHTNNSGGSASSGGNIDVVRSKPGDGNGFAGTMAPAGDGESFFTDDSDSKKGRQKRKRKKSKCRRDAQSSRRSNVPDKAHTRNGVHGNETQHQQQQQQSQQRYPPLDMASGHKTAGPDGDIAAGAARGSHAIVLDNAGKQERNEQNHGAVRGVGSNGAKISDKVIRQQKQEARLVSKVLESVRHRHREEMGKGRPLIGWNIASFAQFAFEQLRVSSPDARTIKTGAKFPRQGAAEAAEATEVEEKEAVAAAVDAVTASAEAEYAGQVTISEFEALLRREADGFTVRRQAGALLRRALEQEQAGDLDAAEAGCAACLAGWPGFGEGHLKMAQILRARGLLAQGAIHDVEFHLRQALCCASKARQRGVVEAAEALSRSAAEQLSLLLCQEGRDDEAAKVLERHGFRYRLSSHVLRYDLPEATPSRAGHSEMAKSQQTTAESFSSKRRRKSSNGNTTAPADTEDVSGRGKGRGRGDGVDTAGEASKYVAAMDSTLPPEMLGHLQEAFGSGSRFWSEHGYNSETGTPGYFSYVHSLDKPPSTSLEQIINHLRAVAEIKFPEVKEAKFVEWWAHRRPHSSGHQMHFDSDNEGTGGVRNPIVSIVVYVTGDVGGPTLVTTQRLTSKKLAERGWMVHPRVNRVCMFDGGVLHGVIPGRGVPGSPSSPSVRGRGQGVGRIGADAVKSEGEEIYQVAVSEQDSVGSLRSTRPADGSKRSKHTKKKRPRPCEAGDAAGNAGASEDDAGQTKGESAAGRRPNGSGDQVRSKMADVIGVIGASSLDSDPAQPSSVVLEKEPQGKERAGMRVTWMVAFWKDIQAREPPIPSGGIEGSSPSGAGAAQPFPVTESGHSEENSKSRRSGRTWPELFRKKPEGWGLVGGTRNGATPVTPVAVPQVWEDVDGVKNERIGVGVRRLKKLPDYDLCFQGF